MKRQAVFWRVALLALPLSVFGCFVVWPLLDSFYYSFTDWNGFDPRYRFVGAANFVKVATDRLFTNATLNTVIWMVLALLLPTPGRARARLAARFAGARRERLQVRLLPADLPLGGGGRPDLGLDLPAGLGAAEHRHRDGDRGAGDLRVVGQAAKRALFGDRRLVLATDGAFDGDLPRRTDRDPLDLLEAASIEGATRWQRTRYVVLPLLRPATVVVVALSVINSLKGFDILYIMTGGGPFHSSDTLAMHMYNESFKKYKMGYGSAISVILFLLTLAIIFVYFRQLRKLDELHD